MGACCSTASRSAVLASSFVIVVSVPVLFYSCILLRFRSAELQSTGFTVFTVVAFAVSFLTAVLGIVGRDCHHVPTLRVALAAGFLATVLALAYTVWGSIVLSSMFDYPESRALMIGTFVLITIPTTIVPPIWCTVSYYHLSILLRAHYAAGLLPLDGLSTPSSAPARAGAYPPRQPLPADQARFLELQRLEAGSQQQQAYAQRSLGRRQVPLGRARRGSLQGSVGMERYAQLYARLGEDDSESSGGEGRTASSDDDEEKGRAWDARSARKGRGSGRE